jgi:hypothetical protein
MEPRSRSNDDQTQYQAQYWNGPEAGPWLVQEQRARLDGLTEVGFKHGDAQRIGSHRAARRGNQPLRGDVLQRPTAAFANIARGLRPGGRLVLVRWQSLASTRVAAAVQAALETHLTCDGVRLESWAWLVTARNPWWAKGILLVINQRVVEISAHRRTS